MNLEDGALHGIGALWLELAASICALPQLSELTIAMVLFYSEVSRRWYNSFPLRAFISGLEKQEAPPPLTEVCFAIEIEGKQLDDIHLAILSMKLDEILSTSSLFPHLRVLVICHTGEGEWQVEEQLRLIRNLQDAFPSLHRAEKLCVDVVSG